MTSEGLTVLASPSEPDLFCASVSRGRVKLIRAASELARLNIGAAPQAGRRIAPSTDVWSHMRARLSGLPAEEFWAIALDTRYRVLLDAMFARHNLTEVDVHDRYFAG